MKIYATFVCLSFEIYKFIFFNHRTRDFSFHHVVLLVKLTSTGTISKEFQLHMLLRNGKTTTKKAKHSMKLIASLAPGRAEIEAGVVAKADQHFLFSSPNYEMTRNMSILYF
jgi:hypothetical protein